MADLQRNDIDEESSAAPESRGEKSGKKKKKKRGCGFFIVMLLIAAGATAGLQLSGGMDFRPEVYPMIPRIPYIGQRMAKLLNVPEVYSLTADERRRIELDEWERSLAETKRLLDQQDEALRSLSEDLSGRGSELEEARAELAERLEALSADAERYADTGGAADGEEIRDIVRTFEEMSPKNAAAIIEKLTPNLAAAILDGMPEDFRARTLGRMDAAVAAELTEQLTRLQRNK
jgi:flagellar motility protein MotE (MotC chaperone)